MRDIELLTNKKMVLEDVYDIIKKNFKIVDCVKTGMMLGKYPRTLDLDFYKGRMYSDCEIKTELFDKEYKNKIPLGNAYRAIVGYHLTNATKKLVTVLLNVYPELCVYDNDEDWIGTAKEYLEKEYEY